MNERIKELIKQHGVDITIDGMGYGEGNIEGLAELIVQECSQYIEDKFDFCGDEIIIAEKLREHFGVEE